MATATLNVWITNLGDPGSIANEPHWVVAVLHPDGRVLNWSEGRYRFRRDDPWIPIARHEVSGGQPGWWYNSIPTRDGHVEIEVPPGTYSVIGSLHTWFVHGLLYGNWATDHGIAYASCDSDACVTLYAPTDMACWRRLADFVIPSLVRNEIIDREVAERALEAMREVFNRQPSRFERAELETLGQLFAQMGQELPGEPKQPG